jgi:hypothetical protein
LTDFAIDKIQNGSRAQSAALENSHLISPHSVNAVRAGFSRTLTRFGETTSLIPATEDPSLAFLPKAAGIGTIDVQGLTLFPGGTQAQEYGVHAFTSYQASDDFTHISGNHFLALGGRAERTHFNTNNPNTVRGEYRFGGIASFLTNVPNRLRAMMQGSDAVRGFRQWIGAAYFQDTWRARRRFTLELGLRHEQASVPTEVNGKLSNLDELTSLQVRTSGPLYESSSLRGFSPRAGIAWDLLGGGATVIRGGYGLYPDLILSQYLLLAGLRNPPFYLRGSTASLRQGDFPAGGYRVFDQNPKAELRAERIQPRIAQPYLQHWNLNLEQRLGARYVTRLAYVGSHGLNLSSITNDANLAVPAVLPDGKLYFPAGAQRLNPVFSQIRNRTFDAHSFYHGFLGQLRRRWGGSFQGQLSYTFSKSIDDSSSFLATAESDNAIMLPANVSPRFNRGLSSHDVRQALSANGLWSLPSPTPKAAKPVLGGWQLGVIMTYASGLPFSARLGYDAARTLTSTPDRQSGQRPDLALGARSNPITRDPNGWVDLSAFTRPQDGFLGNLGRNTLIGPDTASVDLSLVKHVRTPRMGEDGSLDLRIEFFNLFNRVNFDLPSAERMEAFSRTSTREDFGRITSAGQSREIQFGIRLRF